MHPSDPADRRRAQHESMRAKAAQLAELATRTDHNGHARPALSEPSPGASAPPTATPAEPPAHRAPIETLHSTGAQLTPEPPTLPQQIAAAERSGDWTTARRLKTAQLVEIAHRANGDS